MTEEVKKYTLIPNHIVAFLGGIGLSPELLPYHTEIGKINIGNLEFTFAPTENNQIELKLQDNFHNSGVTTTFTYQEGDHGDYNCLHSPITTTIINTEQTNKPTSLCC